MNGPALPVTEELLDRLKREMLRLAEEDLPFEKITVRTRMRRHCFTVSGCSTRNGSCTTGSAPT